MDTTRKSQRFAVAAGIGGVLVAAGEGYAALGCASLPSVIIAVAGAFGAGASLTLAVARRKPAGRSDLIALPVAEQ